MIGQTNPHLSLHIVLNDTVVSFRQREKKEKNGEVIWSEMKREKNKE